MRIDLPNCPGTHDGDLNNPDKNITTEYGGAVEIHRPGCDFCSSWNEVTNSRCV